MALSLKRKRDVEEFCYLTASQMQTFAVARTRAADLEALLHEDDDDDEESRLTFELNEHAAAYFRRTSACLMAYASTLSGAGSRGRYNQFQKCTEFFPIALGWPDRHFRHEFRMGRVTFDRIVHRLEENPIFWSTGKKPQRPVRFQLACFLMRYGATGADPLRAAYELGIGHGTVFKYCRRVTRALRELGLEVVTWGDDERQDKVAEYIMDHYGLPCVVGILDGSLIRLTEYPWVMGPTFMCRKHFLCVNVQATCDHEKRFTSFELGWPGSVGDVTIWKKSHIWRNRHEYLKNNRQVLADKGYPSSPYVLRPFTDPEINDCEDPNDKRRRKLFNKRISSIRIRIEHSFGLLKGRFPSLKLLPPERQIRRTYNIIEAMMVLHNLCIDMGDHPEEIPFFNPTDDVVVEQELDVDLPGYGGNLGSGQVNIPVQESDEWLTEQGRLRRVQIMDEIID